MRELEKHLRGVGGNRSFLLPTEVKRRRGPKKRTVTQRSIRENSERCDRHCNEIRSLQKLQNEKRQAAREAFSRAKVSFETANRLAQRKFTLQREAVVDVALLFTRFRKLSGLLNEISRDISTLLRRGRVSGAIINVGRRVGDSVKDLKELSEITGDIERNLIAGEGHMGDFKNYGEEVDDIERRIGRITEKRNKLNCNNGITCRVI